TFAELVFICRIPMSNVAEVSEIAEDMTIPTDDYTWNCQNYVVGLLGELGAKGLLEAGWKTGADAIEARMDN
ncbi:hypothetical protein MaudCBS49596_008057, partial [Microsporum audouinii]